jgi:hypothetical protein
MSKILNLDKLVKEDIEIIWNGETYKLPGDIPVDTRLENWKLYQEMQEDFDNIKIIEKGIETLFEIFKIRYPEMKYDKFRNMTIEQYNALYNCIFREEIEDESKKKTIEENMEKK